MSVDVDNLEQVLTIDSESTSIPVNPRTSRPVGYAFVDLKKADDAQKAIDALSGKDILERKVSVQLARKPDAEAPKATSTTEEGAEARKRSSGRGRGGRGRGRGGRTNSGREKTDAVESAETAPPNDEVLPLQEKTNEANQAKKTKEPKQPKQRGPPEDGIASTTKVMVANLPYDLTEEKVCPFVIDRMLANDESAQGTLRSLQTCLCQDCSSTNSKIHDQETQCSR